MGKFDMDNTSVLGLKVKVTLGCQSSYTASSDSDLFVVVLMNCSKHGLMIWLEDDIHGDFHVGQRLQRVITD